MLLYIVFTVFAANMNKATCLLEMAAFFVVQLKFEYFSTSNSALSMKGTIVDPLSMHCKESQEIFPICHKM